VHEKFSTGLSLKNFEQILAEKISSEFLNKNFTQSLHNEKNPLPLPKHPEFVRPIPIRSGVRLHCHKETRPAHGQWKPPLFSVTPWIDPLFKKNRKESE